MVPRAQDQVGSRESRAEAQASRTAPLGGLQAQACSSERMNSTVNVTDIPETKAPLHERLQYAGRVFSIGALAGMLFVFGLIECGKPAQRRREAPTVHPDTSAEQWYFRDAVLVVPEAQTMAVVSCPHVEHTLQTTDSRTRVICACRR